MAAPRGVRSDVLRLRDGRLMGEDRPLPTTTRPFRIRHALAALGLVAAIGVPLDHASAAQVAGGGVTTNATAAPRTVPRGSTGTISVPVTASTPPAAPVDPRIYHGPGRQAV